MKNNDWMDTVEKWVKDIMLACSFSLFIVVVWTMLEHKAEVKKENTPLPARYIQQI